MPATSGYNAGIQVNDTQLSYGVETTWAGGATNTPPAVAFKAIRYMSETLSGSKTRTRPQEISNTWESQTAVTTQEQAAGAINAALSFNTFDDWFASGLNGLWGAAVNISGTSGNLQMSATTAGVSTLTASTGTPFNTGMIGTYVRTLGFTSSGGQNNQVFYVQNATTSALTLVSLGGLTTVSETPPGSAAQVRGGNLINSNQFTSLFVQQKLASNLFFRYPGLDVSGFTISGQVGQMLTVNFDCIAQQELTATTDASTGAVTAAPSGTVANPVGNFQGIYLNNAALGSVCDQFSLQVKSNGAAAQYGLGSSAAAGVLPGTLEVSGSFRILFKDFTLYQNFKSETAGRITIVAGDGAGNKYAFQLPNATIVNPQVSAGGVGQAVLATFNIEGNPQAGGGTLSIDRMLAS